MDHLKILRATGGLPPSAFTLQSPGPVPDAQVGFLTESLASELSEDALSTPSGTSSPDSSPLKSNESSHTSVNEQNGLEAAFSPLPKLLKLKPCAATREQSTSVGQGRFVIPDDAKEILEQCFWEQPYPSTSKQAELAEFTGLTPRQVKTWFNNARSRRLKNESKNNVSSSSSSIDVGLTKSKLDNMADKLCEPEYGSNLAMERFLDTPMDEYPADLSTIEKAASKLSLGEQTPRFEPYPRRRSYARSNGSSCSSLGSASTHSIHSFYSFDSRPSRRGRRKIIGADLGMPIANHSPGETKLFYCTFCPKSFPGRYEWNRHEEAVHIPRKVWVCNVYENHRGPPGNFCPYCDETNPSSSHLEEHKHTRCGLRPEADRTFLRKDHLKQHLLHFHGCSSYSLALTTVNSFQKALGPIDLVHPALHCGFCGFHALDWEERVEHIATHFKAGVDLLEWWLQRNKSSHESHQVQTSQNCDCHLYDDRRNICLQIPDEHPGARFFWSCSFLPSAKQCFTPPAGPDLGDWISRDWKCHLCSEIWKLYGFEGGSWADRVDHLSSRHKYRACNQRMFLCGWEFFNHLVGEHSLSQQDDVNDLIASYRLEANPHPTASDAQLEKAVVHLPGTVNAVRRLLGLGGQYVV